MKHYASVFSNAARLRAMGNDYIVGELAKAGLENVVASHGDVLVALFEHDGCNMRDLVSQVRRTKSTVTVLVDKLEKAGYVERSPDPSDQRAVRVHLTQKGHGLKPVFESISQGLETLLSDNLSAQELQTLDKLLSKAVS